MQERDVEREQQRKEIQHLRESLDAMHERLRVLTEMVSSNPNFTVYTVK